MTIKEAADRIGISASKLYQLVARHAIGHYRVGGKILFDDEDIDRFKTSCRVGPAKVSEYRPPVRLKHLKLG